ncbi:unnamed protein product [Musa acuminata var. zebrina]
MDVCSVAALFVLFFASLLFFCKRRSRPPEPADLTLLRSYPVVGNLPHFVKNRHRLLEWVTELVAASPTATVTVAPFVFTASSANVEHVTKANFGNYPKGDADTASFEFNTRASRSGDVVDLQDVLERFAFDNICSLVFGMDPKCLGGGSEEGERCLRESMSIVHDVIEKAVKARRSTPIKSDMGSDFLSRFAADGANSDEYVRDILISFVLAGRDTTPSALTWFFWLLSSRPDVVNRIREESLRLYPPGWTVMYNAYAIARREGVWGADCGEFRPERWLDEEGVFRPKSPFVFPVFHAGPRMCLGKDMAYIQMKALVAGILERFDVEVAEERRQPRHLLTFTMRMEGGLPVRVKAIEGLRRVGNAVGKMELCVLPLVLFFSFLFSALLLFFKPRCSRHSSNPGKFTPLGSYPVVGNIPHLVKNSRRMLDWSTELILASPTPTVTVAPFVFTANPANVEHVAKTRFANYPKSEAIISTIRDCLGGGILNTNGEEWRLQRKAASYEFNTRSLRAFVLDKVRYELLGRLLPCLAEASRGGEVLDLQDVLERFAFDNICSLVFGEDPRCLGGGSEEGERFFHAFDEATRLSVDRAMQPFTLIWRIKKWLDIGTERQLRESMEIVHGFVDRCVRSSRDRQSGGHDFLSRFALGSANSDEYLRDILISFVLAGRDTTPSALTWFFWALSSRPDVVDKIRDESLRLYPPAIWGPDGGQFRPERWLDEGVFQPKSPALYPVFHTGPRTCLGKDMAYIQMKALAACILERFDVELAAERGRHQLAMTMRMEGGLPVRVKTELRPSV